ncbi:hypothetical protein SE15_07190 [Thermanaerothrix daxensis]|uniref:Uncharacterized protein n=1 Tax=Thermanaerothrix daxensis TaxID=869279 RepID=A0A0N8GQ94_9CHLR|nr:hypothetical protein SE15_07190 [Thermanaerothrix daxensis]
MLTLLSSVGGLSTASLFAIPRAEPYAAQEGEIREAAGSFPRLLPLGTCAIVKQDYLKTGGYEDVQLFSTNR